MENNISKKNNKLKEIFYDLEQRLENVKIKWLKKLLKKRIKNLKKKF